jgi:hypothetical protein
VCVDAASPDLIFSYISTIDWVGVFVAGMVVILGLLVLLACLRFDWRAAVRCWRVKLSSCSVRGSWAAALVRMRACCGHAEDVSRRVYALAFGLLVGLLSAIKVEPSETGHD